MSENALLRPDPSPELERAFRGERMRNDREREREQREWREHAFRDGRRFRYGRYELTAPYGGYRW